MAEYRVREHPILKVDERPACEFFWQGRPFQAFEGETISSALFGNGVRVFGHHHKDGAPQGIFCANGQCAQCTVIVNGLPVKACMTALEPGMVVEPLDGLPALPEAAAAKAFAPVETVAVDCLIIGAGPAGLSAAVELGKLGILLGVPLTCTFDDLEQGMGV